MFFLTCSTCFYFLIFTMFSVMHKNTKANSLDVKTYLAMNQFWFWFCFLIPTWFECSTSPAVCLRTRRFLELRTFHEIYRHTVSTTYDNSWQPGSLPAFFGLLFYSFRSNLLWISFMKWDNLSSLPFIDSLIHSSRLASLFASCLIATKREAQIFSLASLCKMSLSK